MRTKRKKDLKKWKGNFGSATQEQLERRLGFASFRVEPGKKICKSGASYAYPHLCIYRVVTR
jgi:hypothetical protein